MKSQLKSALAIALTLAITTPALAGGIPVIDGAAIATAEKNSLAELAQMAKQLAEAKAQLEQLKASVKAMTATRDLPKSSTWAALTRRLPTRWKT